MLGRRRRSLASYRHTQVGWLIVGVLLVVLAILLPILTRASFGVASIPPLVIVALGLCLFSTITVIVDDRDISIRMGVGLISRRIPRATVRRVTLVRNKWYWGWGVRLYSGGTLYTVSGLMAVQLTLTNGREIRIGTDEPDALM